MIRLGEILSRQDGLLTFAVADDPGSRVSVEEDFYHELREGCDWSIASDDMTDHALGLIEHLASEGDERIAVERA